MKAKAIAMMLGAVIGAAAPAAAEESNWEIIDPGWPQSAVSLLTESTDIKPVGACVTEVFSGPTLLLSFACRHGPSENRLEAAIDLGGDCSAVDGACIRYKVDGGPAAEECSKSYGKSGAGFYLVERPAKLLRALAGKSRLLMEVPTDNNAGRLVAEFNVAGLTEKLPALQPYCDVRALLTAP